MKDKKVKHGKENTIGKIIYGFLLFMPLLAIGITCAYVIFNKNAYQSYDKSNVINETSVSNSNMLLNNYYYQANIFTFIDETSFGSIVYINSFVYIGVPLSSKPKV